MAVISKIKISYRGPNFRLPSEDLYKTGQLSEGDRRRIEFAVYKEIEGFHWEELTPNAKRVLSAIVTLHQALETRANGQLVVDRRLYRNAMEILESKNSVPFDPLVLRYYLELMVFSMDFLYNNINDFLSGVAYYKAALDLEDKLLSMADRLKEIYKEYGKELGCLIS